MGGAWRVMSHSNPLPSPGAPGQRKRGFLLSRSVSEGIA
jgi:hypothetical protein